MAFFNDLVRVIAEIEGMDVMTVRGIGIAARDAGHISKSGRGLSAARMTVRDAANLLIAVNATDKAKDAGSVIPVYRDLVGVDLLGADHELEDDPVDRALRGGKTFGEALEVLIEASGRLGVNIAFSRPQPAVTVDLGNYEDPDDPEQIYLTTFRPNTSKSAKNDGPDRSDLTKITERTLIAVARVLAN